MAFVGWRMAEADGGLLEDAAPSEASPFPLRPRPRVLSACSLRQRLVNGRLAGPISCECSEMSVGPGKNEGLHRHASLSALTHRAHFIRIEVGLVADRRRTAHPLELPYPS